MVEGYLHSVEVGSFVDGPGLRFVAFLAGCPMRCAYCHNPDTWQRPAEKTSAADVIARIEQVAPFLISAGGGVTVSGGEPLMQPAFAREILIGSQRIGLHTALDTAGFLGDRADDALLGAVNLVLLDIKSFDECGYRELTGVELEPTLRFARRLSAMGKPMWIRFVLVPGLTDDADMIGRLADFIAELSSVQRVEVLPFHQMGRHKWEQLGLAYKLGDVAEPTPAMVEQVRAVFAARGLPVDEGHVTPSPTSAHRE